MRLLSSKPSALLLKTLWGYLGFSLLLLILPVRWLQPVRGVVLLPFGAAQRALFAGSAPIEQFPERLAAMWGRAGRESRLQEEVARLRARLAAETERRLSAEARLRQMGLLPADMQSRTITARVIGYDSSPLRASVSLDQGASRGVRRGAAVLCEGALAGTIASTTPVDSRALLLSDPACRAMVRCARSRVMGVLEGAGGGNCIVKYIPLNADVQAGDIFVTSGMDSLPDGILAGVCIEATRESGEPTQWVTVQPTVDAAMLEHVAIVIKAPVSGGRE